MERISGLMAALSVCAACSGGTDPLRPTRLPAADGAMSAISVSGPAGGRQIMMLDQCEPDSFNAVIGPGTCINRRGGITFDVFIALLQRNGAAPSWRFSPDSIHVAGAVTLPIVNRGGEAHTFTEVEAFGGGIVPDLNVLAGTPVPAPECLALGGGDFIAPGAQTSHTFAPGEADRYQCCIHPWMRAVTR